MLSVPNSRQYPLTTDCLRTGASQGVNESAFAMAAPADSGQHVGIRTGCPAVHSGFVHAASVLPKFLTVSAASLLLAKQVLKPLSPGASHAATVEHAMKQNVSGCELPAFAGDHA